MDATAINEGMLDVTSNHEETGPAYDCRKLIFWSLRIQARNKEIRPTEGGI